MTGNRLPAGAAAERVLLDADALGRTLLAHRARDHRGERRPRHGRARRHPHARRAARAAAAAPDRGVARRRGRRSGTVDITFYRDDVHVRGGEAPLHAQPVVRATRSTSRSRAGPCVLVDDVLYTGRTIRAAIEALFDYGRPGARPARRPRRPRPPRAPDPPRLRRQEPADVPRRAHPGAARRGGRGRPRPARSRPRRSRLMAEIRVMRDDLPPRHAAAAAPDLDRRPRPATTSSGCSRPRAASSARSSAR